MKIDATTTSAPLGFAWHHDCDGRLDGRLLGQTDSDSTTWETALRPSACNTGTLPSHATPASGKPVDLLGSRLARTLIRDFVPTPPRQSLLVQRMF